MSAKELKSFTAEEVEKHNKDGDLYFIIDSKVYDVSKFANLHPGGKSVLLAEEVRGQDVTEMFYSLHRSEVLQRPQYARLQVGTIKDGEQNFKPAPAGSLSQVPYGEPQWLSRGYHSPYYNESHRKLQAAMRKLVDEEIAPEARAREADGKKLSQEFSQRMGDLNVLAMRMGPGKHLQGRNLLNGVVKPEEYNYFHELIVCQEIARHGRRGFWDGFNSGMTIGLPPVLNYASPELKKTGIVDEVLSGKKYISLAISEAFAGSDVAGLKTTAVKSEDGKEWIITGTKKWITNGHFSDYFSTACNTGSGLTMILIPRSDAVNTKAIKTSYSSTAGTAYITFDGARAPVDWTLGEENKGLKVVLSNFNHERWMMTCYAVQGIRNIVDECFRWTNQRIVFGKPLIEQAVVRAKMAQMISGLESSQTWLEHITFQMCNMNYAQQSQYLAGSIGLLKQYVTRHSQKVAEISTQIFGGRAITQSGMGDLVELYHRTVTFDTILGGAEDVLADLGVKQAYKYFPKNVRL